MNARIFVAVIVVLLLLIVIVTKIGDVRHVRAEVSGNEDRVACAQALHAGIVRAGIELDSQCLGRCGNYSVDLVHVPRLSRDDLPENQCRDYTENITVGFIELDRNGDLVRIEDKN